MVMPPATRAGDVYNGITALRLHHSDKRTGQHWVFRCRCGREWVCRAAFVRSGHATSCGQGKCRVAYQHGYSSGQYVKEYRAFYLALSQCYNPNNDCFPEVGAKGIKVCARWRRSFKTFLADVGLRPKGKLFLQRIDRSKDFKRGNVRWADRLDLGCHQKRNRWLTLDEITLCKRRLKSVARNG